MLEAFGGEVGPEPGSDVFGAVVGQHRPHGDPETPKRS